MYCFYFSQWLIMLCLWTLFISLCTLEHIDCRRIGWGRTHSACPVLAGSLSLTHLQDRFFCFVLFDPCPYHDFFSRVPRFNNIFFFYVFPHALLVVSHRFRTCNCKCPLGCKFAGSNMFCWVLCTVPLSLLRRSHRCIFEGERRAAV